ncbi:MAG: hypothetical protein Q8941_06760 [Bacteroidota bacterium]|nr:hypothetical protein [Bacteroidota bacterium]
MKQVVYIPVFCILLAGCSNPSPTTKMDYPKGSFGYDLAFLQKHDSVIVLKSGEAQVVVSPKYQAKVFTSTAEGKEGTSFGWIHYKAFDTNTDPHINAYGGENRLWLGPEGGKFSLFFSKDVKMEFANWKTPAAFDTEPWELVKQDTISVGLQKNMQLVNYAGTLLNIMVNRSITIMNRQEIMVLLNMPTDSAVKVVGYRSENRLTNTGQQAWTESTGMPCLWMLDMFNPSPATVVVIPYKEDSTDRKAKPATTDYFGEIPADRLKMEGSVLFFKADGKMRGKLGIHPSRAKNVAASYDIEKKMLTVIYFDIDNNAPYLNQEWNTSKPPFSGDAVNSYNDGPLPDGSQMGPFYELESVSPAAFLQPGQSLTHNHSVFHFAGDEKGLDMITQKLLGVSINQIKNAFPAK